MALRDTEFRKMVFSIAEKLTPLECKSLHYIHALPEKDRDSSNLEILKELHQKGCFSNTEGLAKVLKDIHREDLAKEVVSFIPVSGSSASADRSDCQSATTHKTLTQLRGKCEANIAQTNLLAKELERSSLLDGISQLVMDNLYRELEEIERSIHLALGRCEVMQSLYNSTGAKGKMREQSVMAEPPGQGTLSKTRNLCPSAQPKPIPQSGRSPPRGGQSTAHRRVRRRSNRQAATLLPALPSPEDLRPSNIEEDGDISTAAATGSVQHCGNKRYIRMKPLLVTSSTSDTGTVMTSGRPKGPQVSNKSDCSGMKRSQSTSDLHHTFPIPRPLKSPQQSLTMRHSEVDSGYYTEITSTGTSHSGWSGGPTYWKTSHDVPRRLQPMQERRSCMMLDKRETAGLVLYGYL